MSEHKVTITLKDNAAVPVPRNQTLALGDTVVYVTDPPNRPFRVVFDKSSPYARKRTIRDSKPYKVTRRGTGTFMTRCFITRPDGVEVGWNENAPESGGEHDVKP